MKPLEEMGKFATIVIDPPWPLKPAGWASNTTNGLKNAIGVYDLMTMADIGAMPVESTLLDDALVFVWCTTGTQREAVDFLAEWGAPFWFTMTWIKNGGIQLPNGPQFNAEWIQVGKRGKPEFLETKAFFTANYWPRGAHSEKPEGFYDLLRRVTPAPRLDIFGRRRIAGFTSWGNEAPEGEPLPDYYQTVLLDV